MQSPKWKRLLNCAPILATLLMRSIVLFKRIFPSVNTLGNIDNCSIY